jgi:cysteine desulfurase / selenocysteine lyase
MDHTGDVVYLDYAATAAIRPPEVAAAVSDYLQGIGATPGRGAHGLSLRAGRVALECRQALARLFNVPGDPGRIAMMPNATHGLNVALAGVLRPGDVAVRTVFDHNAVRRPLHYLAERSGIRVRVVPGDASGALDLDAAGRLLEGARLLVVNAASNVLGTVLPVAELAALAHAAGALVLVDAAQAAGHVPLDVQALGIDLLALTGHKGLLGPQGTGGLWVREGVDVMPLLAGGGGDSLRETMPDAYPDHLEAGTVNGPGIAGLLAGLRWLSERGIRQLHEAEVELASRLRAGLAGMPGVRVLSPPPAGGTPVVSMVAAGPEPAALATRLDREFGVMTRAGLHCAPDTHRLLGTLERGAVRFSLGWATTAGDVERALDAVARITADARKREATSVDAP